jgi:hypothetical protein
MIMKSIHQYILLAGLLTCTGTVCAQTLSSAYFTSDMKFRHTLNPAFGNDQNYISLPGLGNVNVSTQGNFGYEDVIKPNPLYPSESTKKVTTFMNPNITDADALEGFSTGNNRVVGNVNVTLFSAGFKGFGGYNTVEINSRSSFGMSVPYELFAFARNIGNSSYDIGNINATAMSFAELAFGHSQDISKQLRIGAKVKVLLGLGRADVKLQNVKADLSDANKWIITADGQADVSVKGIELKSATKDYKVEGAGTYEYVNDVDVNNGGLNGFGLAVDLGAVYKVNRDWTVSAALLDLGFISWNNDVQAVNRSNKFVFDGFHDVSVTENRGEQIDTKADKYSDQLADFANLKDEGDKGGRTTGIGATANIGVEYKLPVYRPMTFGFLSTTRINGDYSWTEGRLSANWTPLRWLDGGVNFAVSSFTTSMGWIVNIHPAGFNFFIGMDHLLGKMSKEYIPLSSNANISFGMSVAW